MLRAYITAGALAAMLATGFYVGKVYERGQQADEAALIRAAADAFDSRAAARIAQIKPLHQTLQTTIKETTREVPVYAACSNEPGVVRLLDAARANGAAVSSD